MKTSEFDFHLPKELIAQSPPEKRGTSRMMVVNRQDETIEHRIISDFPAYMHEGDALVLNNTKVFPARIFGKRTSTGGKVELLLVEEVGSSSSSVAGSCPVWDCFLKARSRPEVGEEMQLANGRISGTVVDVRGQRISVALSSVGPLFDVLDDEGFAPVPPYIKRDYRQKSSQSNQQADDLVRLDRERYQTVYARDRGSVAAPTAGLHFTQELLNALTASGVELCEVTLHVGPGTFKPVSVDRVEDHVMEPEWYDVSEQAAARVNMAKESGHKIVAVGSTSVRTLETVSSSDGRVLPGDGRSSKFIYPPYKFNAVDAMLTNFHLPKSSLLMMVSALAGKDLVFRAYDEAIREKYRFYSYGDCMLIV